MIITPHKSDVQVYGNVQEHVVGIKQEDLKYITTLLTSNLYSDPERSFIREIVSNGWDAHIEAGTIDLPIIINFDKEKEAISIRDYGVGLSPERFKEIYCNIGSSTKRASNDFIGCFGVGRMAPLACSNTVTIHSYYNGIKYSYIMIKDGNNITINKLSETPTTEKNGLETSISMNKYRMWKYENALDQIVFFPNIYVSGHYNKINNLTIKEFKYFKVCSGPIKDNLLLGNVLYPLNTEKVSIPFDCKDFYSQIEEKGNNIGIAIKFDIGELEVTPNREAIIYSSSSINLIQKRIYQAKEEFEGLLKKIGDRDFDDLYEWYQYNFKFIYYDPFKDKMTTSYGYKACNNWNLFHYTWKGKDIYPYARKVKELFETSLLPIKGCFYNDRFITQWNYNIKHRYLPTYDMFVIIKDNKPLNNTLKQFLREKYPEHTILEPYTKGDISEEALRYWSVKHPYETIDGSSQDYKDLYSVLDDFYKALYAKAVVIDTESQEYLDFKEELKGGKGKPITQQSYTIHIFNKYDMKEVKTFDLFGHLIAWLKAQKKGIVLLPWKENERLYIQLASLKDWLVIKVNASLFKQLQGHSFIIDYKTFFDEPLFKKYRTFYEVYPKGISNTNAATMALRMSRHKKIFNDILCKNADYSSIPIAAFMKCEIDPYYLEICKKFKQYIKCVIAGIEQFSLQDIFFTQTGSAILTGYVLKNKLFSINGKTYKDYKYSSIVKLLCKNRIQ